MKPAYVELVESIRALGSEPRTIGRTAHEFEMVYVTIGGAAGPPILIAAGSHADEPSGVLATVRLLGELRTDHTLTIIPCRDPVGWSGYRYWIERAIGETWLPTCPPVGPERARATCHHVAGTYLRKRGSVLHDDGDLVVASLGPQILAYRVLPAGIHGSAAVLEALTAALERSPRLVDRLRWSRVLLPALMPGEPGCGCFDHAYSVYIYSDGQIGDLNCFFDRDEIFTEVDRARDVILAVKPGLSLDLHEGFGDGFYLFAPPEITGDPTRLRLARATCNGVRRAGFPLATLAELASELLPGDRAQMQDLGDGLITYVPLGADRPTTFSGFCQQYGPAFTIEVGMRRPLAERTEMQVAAVRAAVREFERLWRETAGKEVA
jgi:hypothetical protein